MFAREGYAGTRILDVVREAGVSTGTVYGQFRSKNELLREAVVGASTKGGVLVGSAASLGDLIRFRHPPVRPAALQLRGAAARGYVTARREDEVGLAIGEAYDRWRVGVEPLVAAAEAGGEIAGVDPRPCCSCTARCTSACCCTGRPGWPVPTPTPGPASSSASSPASGSRPGPAPPTAS